METTRQEKNRAREAKNRELFPQYMKNRSITLRNQLVENNLFLVDILVRKYLNKGVEYDDLYQVGSVGLVLAVERFDPTKGYEFSSFATPTIIGEIRRYFRDKGWALKVPRRLKELSLKIPETEALLERKLNRVPTVPELAEALGVSQEECVEAMESGKAYGAYSLQQTFSEDDENESPALEKYASREEGGYASFENADFIRSVTARFPEEMQQVFRWRFLEERTQQQIAETLHVSQMTVSRIERKIRETFKEELHK